MKKITAFFVLSFVTGLCAAPAFAETQNVKVSGSLDAYMYYRGNYDLRDDNDASVVPAGTAVPVPGDAATAINRSEADEFFRSNTQIEVAADLTDNVSTVINLANQRDWNAVQFNAPGAGPISAGTGTRDTDRAFDVDVDLAYVQMKEIFYSPLTLTVGRQDMWFGNGFIIGSNNTSWDNNFTTLADEYSVTTAFDAVRATLDFNPWTIDIAYSNIREDSLNAEDDTDLWITYISYKFAEHNAVADVYNVNELDRTAIAGAGGTRDNDTYTLGTRVQFDPISQMTLGAEWAYQFGNYRAANATATVFNPGRDRSAWAADIFASYRFDNKWKPEATLEWVAYSGEADLGNGSTQSYGAWNALYRGRFYTAYADFREFLYATSDLSDQPATTNQEMIQLKGTIKPLDDLSLLSTITYLWNEEPTRTNPGNVNSGSRSKEIGWEWDIQATYDYTEDVTFGFLAGWFFPGDQYTTPHDATASDMVSSIKVSF